MLADKSMQEMVQEAYIDMQDDKDFAKVIKPNDIYELLSKGYTRVFKLPFKTAEQFQEDNPFITFIEVKEGWFYMRLTDFKMTAEQIKELEGPFTDEFRGKVKDLEAEKQLDNKDVQEEFITDYKGRAEIVTKRLVEREVENVEEFATAKENMKKIVEGLRYTEVWKKELLKALEPIENKDELNKFAVYFYAENERARDNKRTYRDSADEGGYSDNQYVFYPQH